MNGSKGHHAVLLCKGCLALKVPVGCHCSPHHSLPCTGLYSTVQEVERQHEALQEAGSARSQLEGQLWGIQTEVSRLQVRWSSDVVIIRLLGAVSILQVTRAWSDPHVALTAADFAPTSYEFAAWRHSILQRISHVVVAGSCLAPAGQLSLRL